MYVILSIYRILVVVYIDPGGAETSDICSILRDLRYNVLHLFFWYPILISLGILWVLKGHYIYLNSPGFFFKFSSDFRDIFAM